ncbi:MAG: hypothetical protein K2I79_02745, partial [Clostridia bacterium]|nr:hypothetical protein [Clostridia bacterium]
MMNSISIFGKSLPWNAATTLWCVIAVLAVLIVAEIVILAMMLRKKKEETGAVSEQPPAVEEKEPEASTEWYEEPNPEALASEEEKSEEVKEEVIEEPAAEEEDEDVEDVEPEIEDDEEEYLVSEEEGMSVVLEKSYMARLIQTGEKTKSYYSEIKNTLLSYKKVHDRLSRKRETFRFGRQCVAKLAIKGKTLCVYLPINAGDYAESKYKVEDVSSIASNAEAPTIYRIKNARRMKYAKELISQIMESLGGVQREIEAVDYAAELKFKTTGKLIEEDLIRRKLVKTSSVMFGKALELTEEEAAMLAENAAKEKEEAAAEAAAEAISENAEAAEAAEVNE